MAEKTLVERLKDIKDNGQLAETISNLTPSEVEANYDHLVDLGSWANVFWRELTYRLARHGNKTLLPTRATGHKWYRRKILYDERFFAVDIEKLPSTTTVEQYIQEVCKQRDIKRTDFNKKWNIRRRADSLHLTDAIYEIVYVLREAKDLSYPEIGRYLGHRNHSTIIHHYREACKVFGVKPKSFI